MSNTAPEEWQTKKLRDVGKCVRGLTYSPDNVSDKGLLVLRSSNIQGGQLCFTNNVHVDLDVDGEFLSRKGDILICVRNGSKHLIGKSALIKNDSLKSTHGAFMTVFRSPQNGFVWHLVQSQTFFKYVSRDIGATINSINNSNLLEYSFLFPPLPEQQKIATILSSVDDVIEKTRAQIDKLKDLKTGMMQELLTKGIGSGGVPHTEFKDSPVGRIPAGWDVPEIQDILRDIIDYRGKSPPKSESGIPLITAKNIRQGYIDQEPREYIFEGQYASWMVRGVPVEGDVFITTEAPLGNVAKVPPYKFAIGQRVLALCPSDVVDSDFLLYVMQSRYFREQLDLQSTGSTVAGIKQSTFRKIFIALPPLDEQRKIIEPLNALSDRTNNVIRKLNQLLPLKKALMQDLLTGKVRTLTEGYA